MSRTPPTPEQRITQLEQELATTRYTVMDTRARLYRTVSILRSALTEATNEIIAMERDTTTYEL